MSNCWLRSEAFSNMAVTHLQSTSKYYYVWDFGEPNLHFSWTLSLVMVGRHVAGLVLPLPFHLLSLFIHMFFLQLFACANICPTLAAQADWMENMTLYILHDSRAGADILLHIHGMRVCFCWRLHVRVGWLVLHNLHDAPPAPQPPVGRSFIR